MNPSDHTSHDPYAAFRVAAYRNYFTGGFASIIGRQMLAAGVGYEVYARTHSMTALGWLGLMGALPVILLSLFAGSVADRYDRKRIIISTQFVLLLTSLALGLLAWQPTAVGGIEVLEFLARGLGAVSASFGEKGTDFPAEIPLIYLLLFVNGVARAYGWAARAPFMTSLVPRSVLPNAVMWNSTTFELGSVIGPALCGLVLVFGGFAAICAVDVAASITFIAFTARIQSPPLHRTQHKRGWGDLLAGLRFVHGKKVILASLTLDLFAVLFGGVMALLPVFAHEILHVGEIGFGWLRAAPSLGAIGMALALAHLPPMRRAGGTLLVAVAVFGLATIVFGLSKNYALSFAALVVTGAADNISVVVRHTLVQLLTPDSMRGRVAAVNNVFIGSSNELGALESGLAAAWLGPVLAASLGGVATLGIVALVAVVWPELRRVDSLRQQE